MRAVVIPSSGAPAELSSVPVPAAGPGMVLVRVRAAGLNPLDNAIASGALAEMIPHEYPLTLGRDAAGVVEAVGEGVDGIVAGDRVVGHLPMEAPFRAGALAEFVAFSAANVALLPTEVDFATAAALPLAGAAAHAAVTGAAPERGQVMIVNGATGGVGGFVVQLLTAKGVTVAATGTPDDADRLAALGASAVLDYTAGSVVDQARNIHPDGVDGLVELVARAPEHSPLGAVKRGGRISTTTGQPDADAIATAGFGGGTVMADVSGAVIAELVAAAAEGSLTVDVSRVSLEGALAGLDTIAAGTARGKIVVVLDD